MWGGMFFGHKYPRTNNRFGSCHKIYEFHQYGRHSVGIGQEIPLY
jgi:hypothetical protein